MTERREWPRRRDPISPTPYKETIVVMVAWVEAVAVRAATRCRACRGYDDGAG